MFSDPIVAVLSMLMLCFSGILVMFVFVMRSLAEQRNAVREAFRKQQMFMADLERQFLEMSFVLRKMQGGEEAVHDAGGAKKASLDLPLLRENDDLMSLLDSPARTKKTPSLYGDLLLPSSPLKARAAEEYDPATDPHLFDDSFRSDEEPRHAQGVEPEREREHVASHSPDAREALLFDDAFLSDDESRHGQGAESERERAARSPDAQEPLLLRKDG